MTKLTLSADRELIEKAKNLAEQEGTSLSSMFSRFLLAVMREKEKTAKPGPLTRKATGLVSLPEGKSDREMIEEALLERHAR